MPGSPLKELLNHRAGGRNHAATPGLHYQTKRSRHWDAKCSCDTPSTAVVEDRHRAGMGECPRQHCLLTRIQMVRAYSLGWLSGLYDFEPGERAHRLDGSIGDAGAQHFSLHLPWYYDEFACEPEQIEPSAQGQHDKW